MRRGITLLEVLVSILVLVLGLGGLAALLPVSIFYASEATKYDRGSTLAQGVYHDMQIRGYLNPKAWLDTSVIPSLSPPNPPGFYGANAVKNSAIPGDTRSYLYSTAVDTAFLPPVIIDPLSISYAIANGQTPPPLFPAFPLTGALLPGAPTIYRLTLDTNYSWSSEDSVPSGQPLDMAYSMAQRMFMSNDDLVFQSPARADYRPQVVTSNGLPPNLGVALPTPDFQGDFSWLLTISPDIDDLFQEDVANMDRFTVSVVIFYKRDLNLDQTVPPAGITTLDVKKAPPERMVFADLLDASAQAAAGAPLPVNFAGGAVRLRTPPPGSTTPSSTAAWLDVRPNDWLMLSGFSYNPFASVTPPGPAINYAPVPGVAPPGLPIPFCQWYRIAAVGETLPIAPGATSTGWYCDVQLAGPDWNNGFFAPHVAAPTPPFQYVAPDQPSAYPVQYQYATLCTGAIAVYEYQITLDGSLLRD